MRTRPAAAPPKGVTAKAPTIVINTTTQPRSPRRWAIRHTDRIEIGGGALFPQIKSSRKDIVLAVVAMGLAASLVYASKNGFELLKERISKKREEKASIPDPPKIQTIVDCVNSAGEPKKTLIPDMVQEGGPKVDGRGERWTEKDTERLIELASTLETPDKETIGQMMERHPNLIYRKAKLYGIQLMSKPRGRKPKQQGPDE